MRGALPCARALQTKVGAGCAFPADVFPLSSFWENSKGNLETQTQKANDIAPAPFHPCRALAQLAADAAGTAAPRHVPTCRGSRRALSGTSCSRSTRPGSSRHTCPRHRPSPASWHPPKPRLSPLHSTCSKTGLPLLRAVTAAACPSRLLRRYRLGRLLSRYLLGHLLWRQRLARLLSRYRLGRLLSCYRLGRLLSRYLLGRLLSRYLLGRLLSRYLLGRLLRRCLLGHLLRQQQRLARARAKSTTCASG